MLFERLRKTKVIVTVNAFSHRYVKQRSPAAPIVRLSALNVSPCSMRVEGRSVALAHRNPVAGDSGKQSFNRSPG
jgi:hypothetical protein